MQSALGESILPRTGADERVPLITFHGHARGHDSLAFGDPQRSLLQVSDCWQLYFYLRRCIRLGTEK